jgi:hypothetical protein
LNSITQTYTNLPDQELPGRQVTEYMKFAQSDNFFHLAIVKNLRISALKSHFSQSSIRKVFICAHLAAIECSIDGIEVAVLDNNFFQEADPTRRAAKKSQLENSLVIVNSSNMGSTDARAAYTDFFEECTKTCFLAWDHDNHHWLEMSTYMAAHSDIYVPAHHENLYLLSRYNWLIAGPVYSSTMQWSRKFLADHLPNMLAVERSDSPLGMHIPYSMFSFRNQVISTLNKFYPSVGFSSHDFHAKTPEDRLKEWYSYKTHWIVPVLNDVPIRISDALITGGIPIVPMSLQLMPPVNSIPREHIIFYSPSDIVNPQALVERAVTMFNQGGAEGIIARHQLALQYYHGNTSINYMWRFVVDLFGNLEL